MIYYAVVAILRLFFFVISSKFFPLTNLSAIVDSEVEVCD